MIYSEVHHTSYHKHAIMLTRWLFVSLLNNTVSFSFYIDKGKQVRSIHVYAYMSFNLEWLVNLGNIENNIDLLWSKFIIVIGDWTCLRLYKFKNTVFLLTMQSSKSETFNGSMLYWTKKQISQFFPFTLDIHEFTNEPITCFAVVIM